MSQAPITIVEVTTKKLQAEFVDLAWKIYADDPEWAPPLKLAVHDLLSPKHPFYKTATMRSWIARRGGAAVGRISAIVNNEHNKFHGERCGFFGLYECIDSNEVSDALFKVARDCLRAQGMDVFRGPMNPSTNYECGLLVEGPADPPQIMMTYNPPYYAAQFERQGLAKAKDLLAYQLPTSIQMPTKIVSIAKRAEEKKGITYRPISKKHWWRDVELMYEIYNDAWENNWGFVPMSKEEFFHTAKDLKSAVIEDLVLFAEIEGKAAGFIIALPDFNQVMRQIPSGKLFPTGIFKLLRPMKYVTRARIITLGVRKAYRLAGLETLLYVKIQEMMKKVGIPEVEMSWILEDNLNMNRPLVLMGAIPYKRYRIYENSL